MYTYKIGISPEEHDQFVLAQPQAGLLQSSKWGKVKDNWKHERISFYENGVQVAAAACLIRKLPLGFTMIYIPRGPIMDYANFELLDFVIKTLKTFGKSKRALFVKIDPSLVIKQTLEGKESKENDVTLSIIAFLKNLVSNGLAEQKNSKTLFNQEYKPTSTPRILTLTACPKKPSNPFVPLPIKVLMSRLVAVNC